jgi:hypothetical protein
MRSNRTMPERTSVRTALHRTRRVWTSPARRSGSARTGAAEIITDQADVVVAPEPTRPAHNDAADGMAAVDVSSAATTIALIFAAHSAALSRWRHLNHADRRGPALTA